MFRKLLFILSLVLLLLAAVPALALAANFPQPTLALANNQVWLAIIASLVPLVTYVLNYLGPWVTEPIKAAVLVVVAAVVGGLDTAITTNQFGWNGTTANLIITAVLAALVSHHILWKPSGISTRLGGGRNAQHPTPPPAV